MTKHKWILIAFIAIIVTPTSAALGRTDGQRSLEARIHRIVDAYQVENQMSAAEVYNYLHYYLYEFPEIWMDEPDTRVELAPTGAEITLDHILDMVQGSDRDVSPMGTTHGAGTPSEVEPVFGDQGEMHIHEICSPVIEIAGDGKTARMMFNSTGREGSDWAWIKYGVDFMRDEDGIWKMWHYSVFGTTNNSYFQDWADMKGYMNDPGMEMMMPGMGEGGMPGGGPPGMGEGRGPTGMTMEDFAAMMQDQQSDRPAKYKWVYTGGTSEVYSAIPPLYPVPPEPYETWGDVEISY